MKKLLLLSSIIFSLGQIKTSYASSGKVFERQSNQTHQQSLEQELARQKQQLNELEQQLFLLKENNEDSKNANSSSLRNRNFTEKNWQINSYGSLLYKSASVFKNTQDTDPTRRSTTDLERVVIEFNYDFDLNWQAEIELEFEHGGTGSSLEYDGFEEFGEFEAEIEAGGEILVEKFEIKYQFNDLLAIKFGHIFVPVGLGTDLHKPNQYFTTERHWSEASLIPQVWHETGINIIAYWQKFSLQTLITTGLNSEYFRSHHWVASGHQKRFEQVNADDLALTLRLDYGDLNAGTGLGVSYYRGNTSGNRHKLNKINLDGLLTIFGLHGAWKFDHWQMRTQYLKGDLEDSQAITLANKSTPGLRPGNFAQVGSQSESAFIELAYNSQTLFQLTKPLYLFVNYEYANPIKEVEQGIATKRFDIKEFAIGVNYLPTKNIVLKAQLGERMYGQEGLDNDQILSFSLGYYFSI